MLPIFPISHVANVAPCFLGLNTKNDTDWLYSTMVSIPLKDAAGKVFNLRVQPSLENPGEYVLVAHFESDVTEAYSTIGLASFARDRFGYGHQVYYDAMRRPPQAPLGQILGLRVAKSSDGSGNYVLLARLRDNE
jgi:hypothetical protein